MGGGADPARRKQTSVKQELLQEQGIRIVLVLLIISSSLNKTLEESWEHMKASIKDVSLEVLGVKPKKKINQHISDGTKRLLKERNDIRKKNITNDNI